LSLKIMAAVTPAVTDGAGADETERIGFGARAGQLRHERSFRACDLGQK